MNGHHISQLTPEASSRVLEALRTVGVAGNETDRPFDPYEIEQSLRETGHSGGRLATGGLVHPHDDVDSLVDDSSRYEGFAEAEEAWKVDYKGDGASGWKAVWPTGSSVWEICVRKWPDGSRTRRSFLI